MKPRILLLPLALLSCSKTHSDTSEKPRSDRPANSDSLSIVAQFSGPESAQYYAPADEYFVSNVNGDMTEKDDNGFISRVNPDGSIRNLKWIDGATLPVMRMRPRA